jgi:hypothetical protein
MNNIRREIHYIIALIAPLPEELTAAKALLDDRHDGFAQLPSDCSSSHGDLWVITTLS